MSPPKENQTHKVFGAEDCTEDNELYGILTEIFPDKDFQFLNGLKEKLDSHFNLQTKLHNYIHLNDQQVYEGVIKIGSRSLQYTIQGGKELTYQLLEQPEEDADEQPQTPSLQDQYKEELDTILSYEAGKDFQSKELVTVIMRISDLVFSVRHGEAFYEPNVMPEEDADETRKGWGQLHELVIRDRSHSFMNKLSLVLTKLYLISKPRGNINETQKKMRAALTAFREAASDLFGAAENLHNPPTTIKELMETPLPEEERCFENFDISEVEDSIGNNLNEYSASMLQIIFGNLVGNAYKHSFQAAKESRENGSSNEFDNLPKVATKISIINGSLRIVVANGGPSISGERRTEIFDLSKRTTPAESGVHSTAEGLELLQKAVDYLEGNFSIHLPSDEISDEDITITELIQKEHTFIAEVTIPIEKLFDQSAIETSQAEIVNDSVDQGNATKTAGAASGD